MLLFVIDHLDSESDVAFVERIYKEFMPMIKRRIYKHIPNMTVCDDIAHDCFLDIIKYLDSIKRVPEDKLRVYISVCVENNIKRYLKKATKELTGIEETVSNNNNLASGTDVADEVEVKYNYGKIEFKEKPNKELASEYINQGALWNGGVFCLKLIYLIDYLKDLISIKLMQWLIKLILGMILYQQFINH